MARACLMPAQVAEAANIPRSTLNGVIIGRSARPATIGKIAKALNVDVAEILESEGKV